MPRKPRFGSKQWEIDYRTNRIRELTSDIAKVNAETKNPIYFKSVAAAQRVTELKNSRDNEIRQLRQYLGVDTLITTNDGEEIVTFGKTDA